MLHNVDNRVAYCLSVRLISLSFLFQCLEISYLCADEGGEWCSSIRLNYCHFVQYFTDLAPRLRVIGVLAIDNAALKG